jgi:hypothetical protein
MKMANVVAAFMAILIAAAFTLVYMNRASSEVIGAAVPVTFAAFSALALVFAFGRPSPIERTFAVVFFCQNSNPAPIVIPYRPFDDSPGRPIDGRAHLEGTRSATCSEPPDVVADVSASALGSDHGDGLLYDRSLDMARTRDVLHGVRD